MSDENPGNFKPGNPFTFRPGQTGGGGGRKPKPPWLAAKAEACLAWVAGLGAGGARVEAQKAFRQALADAWRLGHLCPHDAPDVEAIMDGEVGALVEQYEPAVTTPAWAPSKDELFAAVKVIEWHYGKAAVSVDVRDDNEVGLLLAVLRERVIQTKTEPKQLASPEAKG